MELMNVCVTVNSKYMRYLYTMLVSLYENHKKGTICLYVINRDFTEHDKRTITELTEYYQNRAEYIWVDEKKFTNICREYNERYPLEIYFRLLIPELIPRSVERVLLLDVDIIVNQNVEELYFIDLKGKYLAAAPNMCSNCIVSKYSRKWYTQPRTNWIHYNTGILLFDLKKIRDNYPKEYLFHKAFQYEIEYSTFEEEVFNVEFGQDNILTLDPYIWNYISSFENNFVLPNFKRYESLELLRKNCAIVHYAGVNPWELGMKKESFLLWWEWAKKTPFYCAFLEEQLKRCEEGYACKCKEKESESKAQNDLDMCILIKKLFGTQKLKDYLLTETSEIYIWGAGKMGDRLYGLFESVDLQGKIKGVIDEKKVGYFHGLKICKYREAENVLQKGCKIIATPVEDQYRLDWEINNVMREGIGGVALLQYLLELDQYSDCRNND